MKNFKKIVLVSVLILSLVLTIVGCGTNNNVAEFPDKDWNLEFMGSADGNMDSGNSGGGNYEYERIIEQPFYDCAEQNTSYFSLDRNTAGYSYVRKQLTDKLPIVSDSVRLEELVNYFDYDYPIPEGDNVVRASTYLSDCPWNENHKLITIGVRTKQIKTESVKNNFVFLLDVSGSMSGDKRIGLAKYGINRLIDGLSDNDRVSVVTYASGVGVKLESTLMTAKGKQTAKKVVNGLKANGSTNGSGGIELAYEIAQSQKEEGVNSRVVLISDGDFNVGLSSTQSLKEFIQEKAKSGVYLSVLGVGMGNTRDTVLETLARNGNGNYAYLDNQTEAEKVFTKELDGMLYTVMKDVKAAVSFTDKVKKYRLLGYDSKLISEEDFNDPDKDAGEIGSNLSVTVMYEAELDENAAAGDNLATVEIRYKNALNNEAAESVSEQVLNSVKNADNVVFAACVAEFGLLLRNSQYKGTASFSHIQSRLGDIKSYVNADAYKTEFVNLVGLASEYIGYDKNEGAFK